jgi:hypothetical protein
VKEVAKAAKATHSGSQGPPEACTPAPELEAHVEHPSSQGGHVLMAIATAWKISINCALGLSYPLRALGVMLEAEAQDQVRIASAR